MLYADNFEMLSRYAPHDRSILQKEKGDERRRIDLKIRKKIEAKKKFSFASRKGDVLRMLFSLAFRLFDIKYFVFKAETVVRPPVRPPMMTYIMEHKASKNENEATPTKSHAFFIVASSLD